MRGGAGSEGNRACDLRLLAQSRRAECGLAAQGMHDLLAGEAGRSGWLAGRSGIALVGLFDPMGEASAAIAALSRAARREDRLALIYKCTARTAAVARREGFAVWPVASEAWIAPSVDGFAGSECAGLRRKLRKAGCAGVRVLQGDPEALPMVEMAVLAADWAKRRGGERGFSMGRFAPGYVAGQRVYLACHNGRLAGFATFHKGGREWVLDLMRTAPDAPDGCMHMVIAQAVEDAARAGIPRLSLAATSWQGDGGETPAGTVARYLRRAGGAGLDRFKAGFDPCYQTLYAAAPSQAALALALVDTARAVRWPGPLPDVVATPDDRLFSADRREPPR